MHLTLDMKTAIKKRIIRLGIALTLTVVIAAICMIVFRPEKIDNYSVVPQQPEIFPSYRDCVIPSNIAPLNFTIREEATAYHIQIFSTIGEPIEIQSSGPAVSIPAKKWRALLSANKGQSVSFVIYAKNADGAWRRYNAITNTVAKEDIDSHIVYRLIPPIQHNWRQIGIHQRCIEDFSEKQIVDNRTFDKGCVNCHTFKQNSPDTMSLQIRSKRFGLPMMVVKDDEIRHVDTRTAKGISPAAYHSWHPSGKMIAFSRNKPAPFEHTAKDVRDVWDADSDLAIYFVDENRVEVPASIARTDMRETWPSWSSDGKHLYFCRVRQVPVMKYEEVRYDLMRVAYDQEANTWGEPETLISGDGIGFSTGEPRESPDGRWLLFCIYEYGGFPIYQRTSDLYVMDLQAKKYRRLQINSDLCDSWHSWSSNSRWIAFSSKRGNGLLTRIYLSYVDDNGRFHKPFVLPQRDPSFYESFTMTYNIPELVTGPVRKTKAQFGAAICEPEKVVRAIGPASLYGDADTAPLGVGSEEWSEAP